MIYMEAEFALLCPTGHAAHVNDLNEGLDSGEEFKYGHDEYSAFRPLPFRWWEATIVLRDPTGELVRSFYYWDPNAEQWLELGAPGATPMELAERFLAEALQRQLPCDERVRTAMLFAREALAEFTTSVVPK